MEGSSRSVSKAVVEFVKDLEGCKADALLRQGSALAQDERLLGAVMEFLLSEQCSEEQQLLERLYAQLLRCYRTFDEHLMRFVTQFVFSLIWRHFSDLVKSRQFGIAIRPGLDALLVAIYNMVIVDGEGHPRVQAYTIPSLSNASLYHDPSEFTVHLLRDSTKARGESEEKRVVLGNYPAVESLTRAKKWIVFRVLMRHLSQDLPYQSAACQKSAIIMCRLLVPSTTPNVTRTDVELSTKKDMKMGLNFDRLNFKSFTMGKDKTRTTQIQSKIILDERFLLDALDILYILAYQGLFEESLGLVIDLLEEGEYRMIASVVLLGSAIRSRLEASKLEPDELDEIPPVHSAAPPGDESGRKPPHSSSTNGSVREKRRKSFAAKKVSNSRADELLHDVPDGEEPSTARSETPTNSILETLEPGAYNGAQALWSPDVSPQQFIKASSTAASVSPLSTSNGVAETIV